jgi:S-(hydroxymethyl)glutathione synthase
LPSITPAAAPSAGSRTAPSSPWSPVISRDNLKVTANENKLKIVDPAAVIQRYACNGLRRAHVRPHREEDHPFYGLDFVHVELSKDAGWSAPNSRRSCPRSSRVAARSPSEMGAVRARLKSWLEPYDCLSPALMDLIATTRRRRRACSQA